MPRRLVIDVNSDLPRRSARLSADALSKVFGGCLREWQACDQNYQCCSYKCRRGWWISAEGRWTYECLPEWAT
jgi:hypothetical protein